MGGMVSGPVVCERYDFSTELSTTPTYNECDRDTDQPIATDTDTDFRPRPVRTFSSLPTELAPSFH